MNPALLWRPSELALSGLTFYAPLTSSLTATVGPAPTFTRASIATVRGYAAAANAASGQTILNVDSGEARFRGARRVSSGVWSEFFADGSPIPGSQLLGVVIERTRTNNLEQSVDFGNVLWVKTRATITPDAAIGPDGAMSADKLVEDTSATTTHLVHEVNGKTTAPLVYTFSVWAKAAERTRIQLNVGDAADTGFARAGFDLAGGQIAYGVTMAGGFTLATARIDPQPIQGYYRCILSFSSDSSASVLCRIALDNGSGTGTNGTSYTGDGTSGAFIWGPQLELGNYDTSYIPTGAAEVIRAEDFLTYPSAGIVTAAVGTAFLETVVNLGAVPPLGDGVALSFSTGGSATQILVTNSTLTRFQIGTSDITNFVVATGGTALDAQTPVKLASSWGGAGLKAYSSGVVATGAFDGGVSTLGGLITIGHTGTPGNSNALNGAFRNVKIFSVQLTDAQVATLP